jgi:glycosyltransferase involved in cell wall biosynthesis
MTEPQLTANVTEVSMNNRIPAVSIGMPVYNGAKYIREALDSLLAQSFTDFELIISDNASTDATTEICQEYAKKDGRIRYILQTENIGPTANFQLVLSEGQGRYFMWAAHDDRWSSNFLELTVAVLENDLGCDLAFSNFIERDLDSGKERLHKVLPSNSKSIIYNYITRTLNMCPSFVYGLYRVNTLKNIDFIPMDFADVHFISELTVKSRIQVIDKYLYIAGTKGLREPYSLTHKKINRTFFLRKQYELLKVNFNFPITQCLFLLVCLVMAYNKIKLWRY